MTAEMKCSPESKTLRSLERDWNPEIMSVTLLYGISFSGYGHIFGVALSLLLNQSMQKGGVCLPV